LFQRSIISNGSSCRGGSPPQCKEYIFLALLLSGGTAKTLNAAFGSATPLLREVRPRFQRWQTDGRIPPCATLREVGSPPGSAFPVYSRFACCGKSNRACRFRGIPSLPHASRGLHPCYWKCRRRAANTRFRDGSFPFLFAEGIESALQVAGDGMRGDVVSAAVSHSSRSFYDEVRFFVSTICIIAPTAKSIIPRHVFEIFAGCRHGFNVLNAPSCTGKRETA